MTTDPIHGSSAGNVVKPWLIGDWSPLDDFLRPRRVVEIHRIVAPRGWHRPFRLDLGVVDVPGGDYAMTLYRIDHEALDRERLKWSGSQEVIVLTPGGSPADAAQDLLPFEPRRDTTWVGKYTINGTSADALALAKMFAAHKASLRKPKSPPRPAPTNPEEAVAALGRFLVAALA